LENNLGELEESFYDEQDRNQVLLQIQQLTKRISSRVATTKLPTSSLYVMLTNLEAVAKKIE
jgi:hypothetical protein